ncbi:MAG TPA: hypothetical protein VK154_17580 [Chitinophagales bacterium]|nr:hypothetical protein [Chitinophagales bacterium]
MKQRLVNPILKLSVFAILLFVTQCKEDKNDNNNNNNNNTPYSTIENTLGYGVLEKVKGIWSGPVSSTTALGSYPEWIVDFRPISENQVSAKNELDTLNDIHMSFFIAKYKGQYRVAFRNGGSFGGQTRVSYFLADSVSETASYSYYRFAEAIKGSSRAYTEVLLKGDSLILSSYTNKYNSQSSATLHMRWSARLQDATSCQAAVDHFSFPKKTLTKDFSTALEGDAEAIYYSTTGGDPYTEADQPYLGRATVNYTYMGVTPNAANKTFLMITTQPLISGFSLNTGNLKYRSRYVILAANDPSFTFNYMHPGTYYLYALYDADDNKTFSSGDWVSTTNATFTLADKGNITTSAQINFMIP